MRTPQDPDSHLRTTSSQNQQVKQVVLAGSLPAPDSPVTARNVATGGRGRSGQRNWMTHIHHRRLSFPDC